MNFNKKNSHGMRFKIFNDYFKGIPIIKYFYFTATYPYHPTRMETIYMIVDTNYYSNYYKKNRNG
jgi:hypothetical protein